MPILPKPPQQPIQRHWSPGTFNSIPNSTNLDVFMDLAQNLIAVVYIIDDERLHVDLRALDSDGVHPRAAGRTLSMSELSRCDNSFIEATGVKLKCYGRYIAVLRCSFLVCGTSSHKVWQLQIWDWQYLTISNSVLSDVLQGTMEQIDLCFLGDNRLLVVEDDLKLYSIGDMSQPPQLLACFLMPVRFGHIQCLLPMNDIDHSSQPQMQAQQTMYISDTKQWLLCITASLSVFIVSIRIFFNLDGMVVAMPIPWNRWGPSNTRMFEHTRGCNVHVSGNQVLQTFPTDASDSTEYILRMMDFSSLAVMNRRGLGRVVNEPSSVQTFCYGLGNVTTTASLPFVEIVWDRKFDPDELEDIWLDGDRIYVLEYRRYLGYHVEDEFCAPQPSRLEVIDI